MSELSVVIPVYGCGGCLRELHRQLTDVLSGMKTDYEIILVDDRAEDGSWDVITELGAGDKAVRGLRLSRNFGQHFAITAGLEHASGKHVIVMDCDLQDDPAYIPELAAKAAEGFDIVYTRKSLRKHGFVKNLFANIYFAVFNFFTDGVRGYNDIGAYSMISRRVVDAFGKIKDRHRHYLLVLHWLGFDSTHIDIEHRAREIGKSSYSFGRLVALALDGITSQSTRLLRLTIAIGGFFVLLAIAGIIALIVLYFTHGFQEGWASTMVLLLFSTGIILFSIGVSGIYIGNIFDQVRARPLYLIADRVNMEDRDE